MSEELALVISDTPLGLPLTTSCSIEDVSRRMDVIDAMKRRLKELECEFDQQMMEWIDANGDVTIGEKRYYNGYEKETKCIDGRGAVESLLVACNGDLDQFCGCLASGALKPGASRSVLSPEAFARFFETREKKSLKEGKPVRKVLAVPTNLDQLKGRR